MGIMMEKRRRHHFQPTHMIPRSYGIMQVLKLLRLANRTSFHKRYAGFIRQYGYRRYPRYHADDAEEAARCLAWLRDQRRQNIIPSGNILVSLGQLNVPDDFELPESLEIVKREAVPPCYLIEGVVKKTGYYDRRNLYRSGLLEHVRQYRVSARRRLYNASDVLILGRAVMAFKAAKAEGETSEKDRIGWVSDWVERAKKKRQIEMARLGEVDSWQELM